MASLDKFGREEEDANPLDKPENPNNNQEEQKKEPPRLSQKERMEMRNGASSKDIEAKRTQLKEAAQAKLDQMIKRTELELTPDEATVLAQSILSEDESEIPGFLEVLSKAFHECPNLPKQEHLPFNEAAEETSIELINKKTPKTPKPRPPDIPSLHYRVEVWRESKENRKQTKITVL